MEGALQNELRLLEAGIRRSEQRLQEFEARYDLSTADFVQRYENDTLEETLEFAEWIGEFRLSERLRRKRPLCEPSGLRIEAYFQQLRDLVDACPVVQSSSITYDKRSTHEGFIRGRSTLWMRPCCTCGSL